MAFQPSDDATRRAVDAFYGREMPRDSVGGAAQKTHQRMAEALNAALVPLINSDGTPVVSQIEFDKDDWIEALHMSACGSAGMEPGFEWVKNDASVYYQLIQEGPSL